MKKGLVSLVGAGPGDPGLLTLKALKRRLPAETVQTLLNLRGRLPTWLAQEVSSLARG